MLMDIQTSELTKKMPFSLEAEQSVLGSIIIDPECFSEVTSIIRSEDFYLESHSEIYLAMQDLFLQNKTIDAVTLMNALVTRGVYSSGDESRKYITLLADIVPTSSNVKDYAKIVHDKYILRRLIDVCAEISESAYSEQDDTADLIDSAEAKIFSIAENNVSKGFTHIREAILENYEHLNLLKNDPQAASGQQTGFSDLDKVLVGMGEGDLVLVGARPGMGKTSFAMNIASKVAMSSKKTVCVFSLEMSAQQLVSRMLSSEALIDSYSIRSGNLSGDEWSKLAKTASVLSECEILIDDTAGMNVTAMRAKLRRVKNLGLIVVDYLQLMQSDRKIDNRVQEVGDISRNLKLLAKDMKVPIICCAQLSRGPESRNDKRPMLSDLRDSGAIEQDADVVLFLYRDEYYDTADKKNDIQNTAEIIVAKNRHGSTSNVKMGWYGKFTKFTSLSNLEEPQ